MQRMLEAELLNWKNQPSRMPLLLRGARQVGKTFLALSWGKQNFDNLISINFEQQREFIPCFEQLYPTKIISSLEAILRQPIIPVKTLLFLDEIQECPQAILALRYFKEQLPDLHIIGAGSLLEFTLNDPAFRMPVGRIQSLYLKPLSFQEYLQSNGYDALLELLANLTPSETLNTAVEQKLQELLREYFVLGGMPEVIQHYQQQHNWMQVQIIQSSLLTTYRNDFGKYASTTKHKYLQRLFDTVPSMVGQHFQYSKVDPDMQARDLRLALDCLIDAGIVYKVYRTSAAGLPLNAAMSEKKFKLLFLDIGLVKAKSLLDPSLMLQKDLMLLNQGMLVEQFVGQELLAYAQPYYPAEIFYWQRDKEGSKAEVDYVLQANDVILPIEVKAGKTGRLRSLQEFMKEKKTPFGIRLSLHPLSFEKGILSVPLYMIHELRRLISSLLA
jgi:uncharacterized protein